MFEFLTEGGNIQILIFKNLFENFNARRNFNKFPKAFSKITCCLKPENLTCVMMNSNISPSPESENQQEQIAAFEELIFVKLNRNI